MSVIATAFVALMPQLDSKFGSTVERQASAQVDSAGKKSGKRFGAALAVGATAVAGVAGLGAALVLPLIKSASAAEQSLGATETVFGKFADSVVSNSARAATKFGLSASTYRENANLIGSLFKNQGVATDELAGKTDTMIGVASDLAATFGGSTTEAVEALGSAFKGEFDPLERYGISLKESSVSALLAARGQEDLEGAALATAKQVAISDLIFKQSKDSMGAFGRESNTLAGQQQRLGANFENLKAKVGTVFLPVATAGLTLLNRGFTLLGPAIARVQAFLAPAAAAIKAFFSSAGTGGAIFQTVLLPILTQLGTFATGTLVPILIRLGQVFTTQIIPAVAAVAAYLAANLLPIIAAVANIFVGRILPVIGMVARFFVGQLLPAVVRIAVAVGTRLKPILDALFAVIRGRVIPALVLIIAKFKEWWPTISRVIAVVITIIGWVLKFAAAILGKVLPVVIRFAGWLLSKVVPAVIAVIGVIIKIIGWVLKFGSGLIEAGKKAVEFVKGLKGKFEEAKQFVQNMPEAIKSALGDLGSLLLQSGRDLIDGLIQGINDRFDALRDKAREIAAAIAGLFPGSPVKEGPLRAWNNGGAGKKLVMMLAQGLGQTAPVEAAAARLAGSVALGAPRVALTGGSPAGAAVGAGVAFNAPVYTYDPNQLAERVRKAQTRALQAAMVPA